MALAFSLTGGLLALAVMALLLRLPGLSLFGVSIAGAAAHNTGQILAAIVVLGTPAPMVYLPPCCSAPWSPARLPAEFPPFWSTGYPSRAKYEFRLSFFQKVVK